jgi:hypothetical protein
MMPQNNMQQNPYGQQMNPQMMGQQVRSPEMFSEQLMNPMMPQMQDPLQGLQPMAEPEGFGVYGQSLSGFADGGAASSGGVPRETVIGGQPHMLAYINPEEEQMLYAAGGSGEPGPGGVPSFRTYGMSPGEANARGGGYQGGDTVGSPTGGGYSNNNSPAELAYVAARQAAARRAAANAAAETQAAVALPDDNVTVSSGPITPAQLDAAQSVNPGAGVGGGAGAILVANQRRKDQANTALNSNVPPANTVVNGTDETLAEKILTSNPTEKPRRTFEQFLNDLAAPPVYDDTTINFDTYGDARAAYNETKDEGRSKFGIPSLLGSAAQAAGGFMAMAGGIRDTDKYAGRDAVTGQQIFETKPAPFNGKSTFYVIDGRTGLVRNVESATDASNNQADMDRQRDSLKVMMDNASSNNSAEELAYVAAKQAEEQAAVNAINNPVVASSYSPTALTRAGIGGGSNVGSFYDTTPNVV